MTAIAEHVISPKPTKSVEWTLNRMRLVQKSLSKTLDAEAKKLDRLASGSKIHADVKADYLELDEAKAEIDLAINELISES
jgi:hypothetical protein